MLYEKEAQLLTMNKDKFASLLFSFLFFFYLFIHMYFLYCVFVYLDFISIIHIYKIN